jgi:hypothetical protein
MWRSEMTLALRHRGHQVFGLSSTSDCSSDRAYPIRSLTADSSSTIRTRPRPPSARAFRFASQASMSRFRNRHYRPPRTAGISPRLTMR